MNHQPTVGIYTPIHKINYEHLDFLVKSLRLQTDSDYFWSICLNGECAKEYEKVREALSERYNDIKIIFSKCDNFQTIGGVKHIAVTKAIEAGANLLLELDYDDALNENAIFELKENYEFASNRFDKHLFFYSNFAHFDKNDATVSMTYRSDYGWKKRPHKSKLFEMELNEMIAFPPENIYFVRIESAPNHLRAFTKEAYEEVGGYDVSLLVGDDHDLMFRMKMSHKIKFRKIYSCLYYQRYDGLSTTFTHNDLIQFTVQATQNKFQYDLLVNSDRRNSYSFDSVEFLCKEYYVPIKEFGTINMTCANQQEMDDKVAKHGELLFEILQVGGVLTIKIPKEVNVGNTLKMLSNYGFQYHSWTEEDDAFILYFVPLKGWYKYWYWGRI